MMSVVYMSWLIGVGLGPIVINFFIIPRRLSACILVYERDYGVVVLIVTLDFAGDAEALAGAGGARKPGAGAHCRAGRDRCCASPIISNG